jgi:hypothetical protein
MRAPLRVGSTFIGSQNDAVCSHVDGTAFNRSRNPVGWCSHCHSAEKPLFDPRLLIMVLRHEGYVNNGSRPSDILPSLVITPEQRDFVRM